MTQSLKPKPETSHLKQSPTWVMGLPPPLQKKSLVVIRKEVKVVGATKKSTCPINPECVCVSGVAVGEERERKKYRERERRREKMIKCHCSRAIHTSK